MLAKLGFDAEPRHRSRAGSRRSTPPGVAHVPFDNVRKRIALLEGTPGPLPGGLPADFLAAWLEHGTGGTCWPSSNGLHALVRACGFDVRRISASMFDRNDHNHGSLIVRLAGEELLVDSSIQCGAPIRAAARRGVGRLDDPVHPIRVEPVETSFRIHWGMAQSRDTMPCRLMNDPVDETFYLERYEISRGYSVFNNALYARRNFPGRLVSFVGNTRHEKTARRRHEPRRSSRPSSSARWSRSSATLRRDRRELREDGRLRLSGARDGTRPAPALRARRPRGRRGSLGLPVLRSRHAAPDLVDQLASRAELLPRRQQGSRARCKATGFTCTPGASCEHSPYCKGTWFDTGRQLLRNLAYDLTGQWEKEDYAGIGELDGATAPRTGPPDHPRCDAILSLGDMIDIPSYPAPPVFDWLEGVRRHGLRA